MSSIWFLEKHTPYSAHMHGVKRVIYSGRTKYQKIDVVETYHYGKCLILDDKIQSTVEDEWIYHESLVQPAMFTHENPADVLVIGGGEGATVREVLKHSSVKEATMVDIDEGVIEASRNYLPEMSQGAFEDLRLKLVIGDGRRFLEEGGVEEVYDVIIIDVTDPLSEGPSYLLYTKEFYEVVKKALKPDGVMATQATSTYYSRYCFLSIYHTLKSTFPIVQPYHAWIPSYDNPWGFMLASKTYDPLNLSPEVIMKRIGERDVKPLKFYTPNYHKVLFTLPKDLEEGLKDVGKARIIHDNKPISMPA